MWFKRKKNSRPSPPKPGSSSSAIAQQDESADSNFVIGISARVEENLLNIKRLYDSPVDLMTRTISIEGTDKTCGLVCIDGLVDKQVIDEKIIQNMQKLFRRVTDPEAVDWLEEIENKVISTVSVRTVSTLDEVSLSVMSGETAVFVDGTDRVLIVGTQGWASRAIEEPVSESLVRGPRDGFVENIRVNTSHIRRRIRDANLRFDGYKLGRRTKRTVLVAYVDGIVHPQLVEEVKKRVKSIDIDDVAESGYIEQWIEDSFLSPFPQLQPTERPDKVVGSLLQGKVAIFLDGTPFVLVAPVTFPQFFQSPEDYYERFPIGTLVRFLRYGAAFIAVFLPALYIALLSYHPGMIPSRLAFSIAGAREGVPFPAFVEAMLMEITIELLREAGLRLPRPIGQTIGIVGGLVIGEAAVAAGIMSPIMVIVVALTAIASFALPSYSMGISLRIMRFYVMVAAAFLGLYGIILVYIMINIHLVNLKSFGIPYSVPFAPSVFTDWRDLVVRAPLLFNKKRPKFMQTEDKDRM